MKWTNQWAQDKAQEVVEQQDPLAAFKQSANSLDVQPNMSAEQVAQIWAERLMQVISKQMGYISGAANAQYSL